MSAHRIDMRLVKEVLRLKFVAHLSHRQIAAALRIGIGTVSNYLAAFERSGLSYPLSAELDEADIGRRLFPPVVSSVEPQFTPPDFAEIQAQRAT